jgi:PTS system ascorbate-specific IIA component
MNVGLLLISHPGIATALLTNAFKILGAKPIKTSVLEVAMDTDMDALKIKARQIIHELDKGDGVLILTDLYGASPCNLAYHFKADEHIRIVSGLNLSMLIRTMNYHAESLDALTMKAASGATDGIRINNP